MKEGKKKITAKKNMSSAKKAAPKNEPPKVKKVDVEEINKDFEDVENEDRRLIVFIAIAILVIVGTVIGLLVGCEKKENNKPEPNKPNTDVVVPEKPDEKGKDDGVRTREIVRKVRSVYHAKKKNSSGSGKKTVTTYNVTFYLGEDSETEEVEKGKPSTSYVPVGYSECTYYKDPEFTEEYDITGNITENVNVYMQCTAIEYSVVYESSDEKVSITSTNPTTYMVTDGEVALTDPTLTVNTTDQTTDETVEDVFFGGWYTNTGLTNKVTSLNKEVLKTVGDDNVIHIYAKITNEEPVEEEVVDEPTTEVPDAEPMQMAKEGATEEETLEAETEELETEVEEETLEVTETTPVVETPVEEEPTEEVETTEPTEEVVVEETEEEIVEVPETEVTEVEETEPEVEEVVVETPVAIEEVPEVEEVQDKTPVAIEEVPEVEEAPVEPKQTPVIEEVVIVKETTPEVTEIEKEPVKEVVEPPVEVVTPVKKEEPAKKVVEEKEPEVTEVEDTEEETALESEE